MIQHCMRHTGPHRYLIRYNLKEHKYCIVSVCARWSGPAWNAYREQSPNSECSFLASFWPKGGSEMNALRARRARALRWNRDCSTHARDGQIARKFRRLTHVQSGTIGTPSRVDHLERGEGALGKRLCFPWVTPGVFSNTSMWPDGGYYLPG